tara:strand:+ start:474 stop:2099 length:1626 start_codon:yes stop_codon:yes gene_type:complete
MVMRKYLLFFVLCACGHWLVGQCQIDVELPEDTTVCMSIQNYFQINAIVTPATQTFGYKWFCLSGQQNGLSLLSNTNIESPIFNQNTIVEDTFIYMLEVFDTLNCNAFDTISIITKYALGMSLPKDTSVCDTQFNDFEIFIDSNLEVLMWDGWAAHHGAAGNMLPVFYDNNYLDSLGVNYLENIVEVRDTITLCRAKETFKIYIDSCLVVWPGDANDDGIVNIWDPLNVFAYLGDTGPSRDTISMNWQAYSAYSWGSSIPELAHADCDGDGIVTDHDLEAITDNYTKVHNKLGHTVSQSNFKLASTLNGVFVDDTVYDQSTLFLEIFLGDSLNPSDAISGLAFSLLYDPSVIVDTSIVFQMPQSTLFGFACSDFSMSMPSVGQYDLAVGRIDGEDSVAGGLVGRIRMGLENVIAFGSVQTDTFFVSFANVKVVDGALNDVPVNAIGDSVFIIEPPLTQTENIEGIGLSFYPNPINDFFYVKAEGEEIKRLNIYNPTGSLMHSQFSSFYSKEKIDVNSWPKGLYIIELQSGKSYYKKKFVKL